MGMKRSQMIEYFAYCIHKCGLPGEWSHKASKEAAIELLNDLEAKGMLPPTIKNPKLNPEIKNKFDYSTRKVIAEMYNMPDLPPYEVNEWEPEDEKN